MKYSLICALLIQSSLVSSCDAARRDKPQQVLHTTSEVGLLFDTAFDEFVKATLQKWHVPGLSIAVVDRGEITSKGYGFATVNHQIATADTQYFTGSTTKAFTAAAVALLVHDEQYPEVKWTSPINTFIRGDFVLEDEHATTHTTIEDALSHRTGLPRHDLIYGQANDTPSSVTQRLRYLPMTAEPRTLFQYCNLMFGVITDLLETVTGSKLENLLREKIWRPLGMLSTTFTFPSPTDENSRLARGYYWHSTANEDISQQDEGQYIPEPYIDIFPISGAGATISTVNDYALWVKALLDAASSTSSTNVTSPITTSIFRDITTPRTIALEPEDVDESNNYMTPPLYALGWGNMNFLGEPILGHSGGLTGFGADVYMLPNKGYGIITMANTAGTSNIAGSVIASRLILRRLGLDSTDMVSSFKTGESLRKISGAMSHPSAARPQRQSQLSKTSAHMLPANTIPLPGSMADFAGLYSHPAYGSINLTIANPQGSSFSREEILEGLFYPRTWPQKIELRHITGTVFNLTAFAPHGLGDIVSGEGIVWEKEADIQAVFEMGSDGTLVEKVGVEIEESMVDMARRMGEEHWRKGMIWFAKV